MSDYIPRVTDYYTVKDALWPMPFNVSNPVLYYDKNAFTAAGLDPRSRRRRSPRCRLTRQKIKATGAYKSGFGLKLDPWYLEQMSGDGRVAVREPRERSQRARDGGDVRQRRPGLGVLHLDERHGEVGRRA